jgi:NAD(P)-dependent dehydrogenase (short-subunit alcohol dehydrogenase family)
MNLKEKVVVITGASTGIGQELAFQFAAKGCKVVLAARNASALSKHAAAIAAKGGAALAVATDVSSRNDVMALAEKAFAHFGRLDIFISNAGISMPSVPFTQVSETDLRSIMNTNFMAGAYAVWAAVPLMEQNGGGQLVFVTSIVGKRGVALNAPYCASKFAMQGLAESIRPELKKKNIRVMTVCPPGVDTPFYRNNGKGGDRTFRVHPVDKICRIIVRACETEAREVLPTIDAKLLHWGNVFFPGLMDWAVAKNKKIN